MVNHQDVVIRCVERQDSPGGSSTVAGVTGERKGLQNAGGKMQ